MRYHEISIIYIIFLYTIYIYTSKKWLSLTLVDGRPWKELNLILSHQLPSLVHENYRIHGQLTHFTWGDAPSLTLPKENTKASPLLFRNIEQNSRDFLHLFVAFLLLSDAMQIEHPGALSLSCLSVCSESPVPHRNHRTWTGGRPGKKDAQIYHAISRASKSIFAFPPGARLPSRSCKTTKDIVLQKCNCMFGAMTCWHLVAGQCDLWIQQREMSCHHSTAPCTIPSSVSWTMTTVFVRLGNLHRSMVRCFARLQNGQRKGFWQRAFLRLSQSLRPELWEIAKHGGQGHSVGLAHRASSVIYIHLSQSNDIEYDHRSWHLQINFIQFLPSFFRTCNYSNFLLDLKITCAGALGVYLSTHWTRPGSRSPTGKYSNKASWHWKLHKSGGHRRSINFRFSNIHRSARSLLRTDRWQFSGNWNTTWRPQSTAISKTLPSQDLLRHLAHHALSTTPKRSKAFGCVAAKENIARRWSCWSSVSSSGSQPLPVQPLHLDLWHSRCCSRHLACKHLKISDSLNTLQLDCTYLYYSSYFYFQFLTKPSTVRQMRSISHPDKNLARLPMLNRDGVREEGHRSYGQVHEHSGEF